VPNMHPSCCDGRGRCAVKRLILIVVLAVGFMLAGCDSPESQGDHQGDRTGNERGAEKAAEAERTDTSAGDEKQTAPSEQTQPPSRAGTRYSSGPSPDEVLSSQYEHINAGRYRAAYDLFDEESQQTISEEQYKAYFASKAPYEITAYSFSSVRTQGDSASVVADLAVTSSDGYDEYGVTQALVREDGSWRVIMRGEQVESFSGAGSSTASVSASASAPSRRFRDDQDASTVMVSRVVDGDTIEISPAVEGPDGEGLDEVRLIGVDTPETVDSEEGVEPMGPEASAFATEELAGRGVDLEFDEEMEDRYGRLLAYVWLRPGGEMFNEVLLEEGYAQAYPHEPNTKYESRFASAQEEARSANLGIWGLTHAEQCELANRGNGIGEGTPGC
jgi:micrococcal nuclease